MAQADLFAAPALDNQAPAAKLLKGGWMAAHRNHVGRIDRWSHPQQDVPK